MTGGGAVCGAASLFCFATSLPGRCAWNVASSASIHAAELGETDLSSWPRYRRARKRVTKATRLPRWRTWRRYVERKKAWQAVQLMGGVAWALTRGQLISGRARVSFLCTPFPPTSRLHVAAAGRRRPYMRAWICTYCVRTTAQAPAQLQRCRRSLPVPLSSPAALTYLYLYGVIAN